MSIQFNGRTGEQTSEDINQKFDEIEQIVNDVETGAIAAKDEAFVNADIYASTSGTEAIINCPNCH